MTLTTERLREIASSPSFSANPLSHEVKYMARELLANREAQPFGYVYTSKDGVAVNFGYELPFMPEKWNVTPVYTAPPAPAVPDIRALTDLIVDRLIDCSAADDDSIADAETFVYNACRAAMLAAAPEGGNEK